MYRPFVSPSREYHRFPWSRPRRERSDGALPRHLEDELRAHLSDALKPLGFGVVRIAGRNTSRSSLRNHAPAKIRSETL